MFFPSKYRNFSFLIGHVEGKCEVKTAEGAVVAELNEGGTTFTKFKDVCCFPKISF